MGVCKPRIFRNNLDGSVSPSTDYHVEESNPNDFALDNLVASRVPISEAPQSENLRLDALDTVEVNTMKLLNANKFTTDNYNKSEK